MILAIACAVPLHASTITSPSCSESDVASAIALAANGDTVVIPSCPLGVTWTSALSITKGITLIGQGAGNTVITDSTTKGDSNCQGVTPLIRVNLSSNVFVRISGLTINGLPAVNNCGESAQHISISGSTHQFRVDHITFNLGVTGVNPVDDSWGVIDHNTFNDAADKFPVLVQHNSWQGVGNFGDNSWAQPDTLGQARAVFIEDNTFNYPSTIFPTGCFDTEAGGRLVFRYNTGCPFVGMHGLESSGRLRSGRQYEIYNNTFTAQVNSLQNMYTGVFLRGGTGMIFNNSFNDIPGSPYLTLVQVNNYRDSNNAWAPWGRNYDGTGCDGRSDFDTNIGGVYLTGTYNGAGGAIEILTDTTRNWTPNQWVGYSAINTTKGWGSAINSSTATTITTGYAQQGTAHSWTSGDGYEIRKAYPCADQIGRGPGQLLSGYIQTPVGPVNQALDPLYAWLNNHNGTNQAAVTTNNAHIAPNRDFYDWTPSFNGSSGVGSGPLSARPASCTPNVAYWATDTNTLYQCSSPNNWTAYYTPYTYPHPLINGSGDNTPPTVSITLQ